MPPRAQKRAASISARGGLHILRSIPRHASRLMQTPWRRWSPLDGIFGFFGWQPIAPAPLCAGSFTVSCIHWEMQTRSALSIDPQVLYGVSAQPMTLREEFAKVGRLVARSAEACGLRITPSPSGIVTHRPRNLSEPPHRVSIGHGGGSNATASPLLATLRSQSSLTMCM